MGSRTCRVFLSVERMIVPSPRVLVAPRPFLAKYTPKNTEDENRPNHVRKILPLCARKHAGGTNPEYDGSNFGGFTSLSFNIDIVFGDLQMRGGPFKNLF